ncbi:PAS domain-containing sensor histidine kinase [Pseudoalteromonas sp. G4]|uniref:PAS domain-containing sensor histidine kinase n=1 Tax=Pseudoalteromonas sp. G4 TaxID=2992761 RepID=UPI00237D56BB|nr:PAS domain-containing protein [Pseudoalteromonas sp. G4]MDE3274069.1 PAS domain-containing protein [Pseudoalteromonas sp. G4]
MTEQFFRGDYMPHGHCYLWQPHILWTHVVSDLLIATAYFSIPFALIMFMRKRNDIGYHNVFLLFSLFILFCGITHLFGIWTIWQGVYGYHGIAKAVTALVSITTAFYLYKLLPDLLRVPTISQYEGIKSQYGFSKRENKILTGLLEGHIQTKWMLDSLPLSFILANEHGDIVFVNEHFRSEFGNPVDKLGNLIHANSQEYERIIQSNADSLEFNESTNFIGHVYTETLSKSVEIILNKKQYEGETQLLITLKDLKEVASLKQQLVETNARFERAISATNDGIWDWNIVTGKQVWTPKFYELIGLAKTEEANYETWFNHIHPAYQESVQQAVDIHLQTGVKYEVEYLGRNSEGEYGWFLTRGNSIYDDKGVPIMMSGSLRYIDEQKQAQTLLDERTQFLEALFMGTNHGIWVVEYLDNDFKFTTYNNTALKWTGITHQQIINKKLSELSFFPDEVKQHLYERYSTCIEQGKPMEYVEYIPFEGKAKWFKTSLYPVNANHLIGSAVDITSEKESQQQLAENHNFLESLLDSSVCGFYIFNLETQQNERINKTYTELLGYDLEDFTNDVDLLEKFHPDDRASVLKHMEVILNTPGNEKHYLEYRFRHKKGHWVWCYSVDSVLERDEDGKPTRMLGTFVDVSDKNEFLNKLKASNEYLEQFAFIASHDLQEPLRKISAFSESIYQRLQSQFKSDPDSEFELERLQLAAKRLSKMIEDLLKLSRINTNTLCFDTVEFKHILAPVLEGLELVIERANASIECENEQQKITVDVGLFSQVMQNLIGNAIKFAKTNTPPKIAISVEENESTVVITLSDNGIGLDSAHSKRIFEPFKRLHTREQYEGSGIGLAIVAQIIKVHNAQIRCESIEGEGTRFIIELPKEY